MTASRRHAALAVALLCAAAATAGCSRTPDAQAPDSSPDATARADADRSFIGRQAAKAIEQAGEKLRAGNITLGRDTRISINGRDYGTGEVDSRLPKAELTPDGGLLIGGQPVEVDAAQHALLVEHRRLLEDVVLAGMAIGVQGADIAGTALSGLGEAVFGGEEGRRAYEARMEDEARRIKDDARKICVLLPPLHDSQQALAAALPAFAPYATMTPQDVADCGDAIDDGVDAGIGAGSTLDA